MSLDFLNALTSDPSDEAGVTGFDEIERELLEFEATERTRLGIIEENPDHWVDEVPQRFTAEEREHTTVLMGGLTMAHDFIIQGALEGLGYKAQAMDVPDYESLRFGKEFGNRGQCNPTYFTVGNLIKHLSNLRDEEGMSVEHIVENYIFVTAGACGPCRFGTYVTEYRKALRDAGFDGFRVMLFQQQGGLKQATGEAAGLELNPKFFIGLLTAIMSGDVLNAVGYRMRPYEVVPGSTNEALTECKEIMRKAFVERKSSLLALRRCRKVLSKVEVDRLQARPKVTIIGEFWAMTTEGDGNYKLQSFLEGEGAEVDVQLVSAWILYNLWEHRHDTKRRMTLKYDDDGRKGLDGKDPTKKLRILWAAEKALRGTFQTYARAVGLNDYHLPDMDEIATISHQYYDNDLRGGEGHMEVGKLIQTVEKNKAHMVISVKPFGCMPSSGVSDGVQSLITAKYPSAIYSAIETTGDGAVNVQSRVQMDLFKARKVAEAEFSKVLDDAGLDVDTVRKKVSKGRRSKTLYYPRHIVAGTAANHVAELSR